MFLALLAISFGYAAWRGGGPERAMAGIAAMMVAADAMLHRFMPVELASVDTGHLAIDLLGATSTTLLALLAHRFWPMGAAVLHILPLLAHVSRFLDMHLHPAAYMTMQVAPSWLVPPLLLAATWRHRQRLQQNGNDPCWHASFAWLSLRRPIG